MIVGVVGVFVVVVFVMGVVWKGGLLLDMGGSVLIFSLLYVELCDVDVVVIMFNFVVVGSFVDDVKYCKILLVLLIIEKGVVVVGSIF